MKSQLPQHQALQHVSDNNVYHANQTYLRQHQQFSVHDPSRQQTVSQVHDFNSGRGSWQAEQSQSSQPLFSIPCAQNAPGHVANNYPETTQLQQLANLATQNQAEQEEDFSIPNANNCFQTKNEQPLSGTSASASDYQLQLQQKAFHKMDQNNMQGAIDDDNFDDLDPNGLIGVIKIKDGLFICDELGAQDLEFVVANKVTRVINCAGTQLRNFWEAIGVMYLTLNWQDDEKQTLFDQAEKIPEEIYRFMEEAVDNHESVMVQSVRAQNRACFVIATFIMRRYRWSLLKTLEFLNSRRPDLEMRPSFLAQLQQYEGRLYAKGIGPKTKRWNELADTTVPDLENDELILRNTYMNSQQGPLVDLSPPPGVHPPKVDRLVWRDQDKAGQPKPLCEENKDEDDLINLQNPPEQLNHYKKPASGLKSKLKNSKLHAAQKRQEQYGRSQLSQNFMEMQAQTAAASSNMPPRASSANSKSKFLTKTSQSQSQNGVAPVKQLENRPASEQQPQPVPATTQSSSNLNHRQGGQQAPSPSGTQQQTSIRGGHQPSTQHIQSSLFYPQPTFQQQKQATLQQKVLSQRPMSHQVRDISPLNSSNLNSRTSTAAGSGQQRQQTTTANGTAMGARGGVQQASSGGYVPFEPKKREMTQKIAPKMPFPMTQDLTNLPLPHTHVQSEKQQSIQNQQQNQAKAGGASGSTNSVSGAHTNTSSSHHNSANHTAPSKLLDRTKSGSQQYSGSNGGPGSNVQHLQGKLSASQQQRLASSSNSGGHHGYNGGVQRGISPNLQAKTNDLGVRNRSTLNSSFKRTAMTAHPPAHPGANGISMTGPGQDSTSAGGPGNVRPGSAPKMRTHTPNADTQHGHTSGNTNSSSLILRSQPSTQSTANGGLNSSMSLSKQIEGGVQASSNSTSSKNMLNSFRNGPIKVMGTASHLSGSSSTHGQTNVKQRVTSSKFVSASSGSQATGVGGRPASAPNKRPPSPSTANNHQNTSGTHAHSNAAGGGGAGAATNQSTTQNRVKYNKGTGGSSLTGNKNVTGAGVSAGGHAGPGGTASQLRQGLNPMLRGYSPSKHRWKIAGTQNGGTTTGTAGNRQNNSSAAHMHHHGHSTGHFGGTNPNVYTRSTKHTPSHTSKV